MLSKKGLVEQFGKGYKKHYEVELFKQEGFTRKTCEVCGKGFWSVGEEKDCGDSSHTEYSFFRKEPRKEHYAAFWKKFANFFEKNGHHVVPRYPVVSRWRDDLPFTIASIVDFQRIENGKTVFEAPVNPLVVPQICLRFGDIANVGVTGRHMSCFMMAGQHSFKYPKEGYWKNECLNYNYKYLTGVLGIRKEEIKYGEDLWAMPDLSTVGPCIEAFSKGLELVNSVFTEFRSDAMTLEPLKEKVIDVGWGFERLLWYYSGAPTVYDAVFPKEIEFMRQKSSIDLSKDLMARYSALAATLDVETVIDLKKEKEKIAGKLGISMTELHKGIAPMQAVYAIADHSRTLLFALSDGALPSNSAGGYNLRVLLRRSLSFIEQYEFDFDLMQLINLHAEDLKDIFPELRENLDSISKVVDSEKRKYAESLVKAKKIAGQIIASGENLTTEKMVTLYESNGVTPEILETAAGGKDLAIPSDFYKHLTSKHVMEKTGLGEGEEYVAEFVVPDLPATRKLFYENQDLREAKAKVLYTDEKHKAVVLDQTILFAETGGQCADHGTIGECKVLDVQKQGDVVVHYVDVVKVKKGDEVKVTLDFNRRENISRHHSATHVMIATLARVFGPHVWQAGSKKEDDVAHVDFTHFEKPSLEQMNEVEKLANQIVLEGRAIETREEDRGKAEAKHGFRIYQGGGAISNKLRLVDIKDYDVECCGGTHRRNTNQVGYIKVAGVENVKDGVMRVYYKAGPRAVEYVQEEEKQLYNACNTLSTSRQELVKTTERIFADWKQAQKEMEKMHAQLASTNALALVREAKAKGSFNIVKEVDAPLHVLEKMADAIKQEPQFACVLYNNQGLMVAATSQSSKENALELLKAKGAKGGGSKEFARGKK